jgi:hypothetical protein
MIVCVYDETCVSLRAFSSLGPSHDEHFDSIVEGTDIGQWSAISDTPVECDEAEARGPSEDAEDAGEGLVTGSAPERKELYRWERQVREFIG